jgi:protocatechuate 3,4-dioxygenase beta subunit
MMPGSERLWYWLVDYYALATCILLGVWLFMIGLSQPVRRLAVSWSAVGGLLALLVIAMIPAGPRTSLVPAPTHSRQPAASFDGRSAAPAFASEAGDWSRGAAPRTERGTAPVLETVAPRSERSATPIRARATLPVISTLDWPSLVGRCFLAGTVLMSAWLALGSWHTAVLRRRSRPAPEGSIAILARVVGQEHAPPALLIHGTLRQPVAVGVWRPAIILPEKFVEAEPEHRLEAALAHEWAHIRNRDLWLIALVRLLLPVLFAHPAYWWLRRRTRLDQEMLADASASAVEGRLNYAEVLLTWSRESTAYPVFAALGSLALFERPSQITLRILTLLDRSFRVEAACPAWWKLALRVGTVLAVLAVSMVTLRPPAAGADPPGPTDTPGDAAHVIDPGGKPVAGAKVYLSKPREGLKSKPEAATLFATTGPDGSFRRPPQPPAPADRRGNVQVVAMAEGYGPALGDPSPGEGAKVLKVVPDDVPIRGRVLDIQGQPVARASVQVVALLWHPSDTLDPWLAKLKTEKAAFPVEYKILRSWSSTDVPSLYPPVATDEAGRFTLKGIGRERIASLLISGPGIETTVQYVATRAMPTIKVADFPLQNHSHDIIYYGTDVDLVIGPCLEAAGTVTDQDTGKPLTGAAVQTTALFGNPLRILSTTTDTQGRYRLTGIPPRTQFDDEQDLLVTVDDGPPYLPATRHLGKGDGSNPMTVDFQLKRGVRARGRVVEKATGQGVRANLEYYILADNPYLKSYPRYGTLRVGMPFATDRDGSFQLAVMPGQGVIGARVGNEHYRLGVGVDTIEGLKKESENRGMIAAEPHYLIPGNYHTVAGIHPREGDAEVILDIALDRGKTVPGTIVGPDGAPLAGARIEGLQDHFRIWSREPLPTAEFLVEGLGPDAARDLVVYHDEKKLAGAYRIEAGQMGPITVKLEPCGTVTGRLVDSGGLSLREVDLTGNSLPAPIKTDEDGRFRAVGLVGGRSYTFRIWKGQGKGYRQAVKDIVVGAGETRDLGDVIVNTSE